MAAWNLNRVEAAFAEAAIDPSLWTKALDVVTAETQAFGAILLPARGDALPNVPYTASIAPATDAYFRDGWYLRDERYKGMPALLKNGVGDDFDVMSHEHMRRHPYYQEFLAPHGLSWYVGVRVSCGQDLWVLSIQRSTQQQPFSPEEKGRLIKLTHSLPTSIAIARLLGAASGSNALDAFELARTAAILIDRHGRVVRPNRSAERVLRGDVRICGGRIVATDPSATASLDRALHELLSGHARAGLASPVKLPRMGQRPLLAYPGRLPAMMSNPMSACQAIVVLIDPDDRKLPQPAILRSAFDLTDAESRLAALLLSGDSLEDLCDRLQIAKETGRNQLKSIFAKTGTHVCKTAINEVHADGCFASRKARYEYQRPPNVVFVAGSDRGHEIEAGGASHGVTSSLINNSTTLVCEWFARAKCGGDNGLAKGFCDVQFTIIMEK
jgi:DNA-binding CsgD family transcriptional regulator